MDILKVVGDKRIIIYGAGIVSRATILALRENDSVYKNIVCCAVKSLNHNPKMVEGIAVREIRTLQQYKDCMIIIATKSQYHNQIKNELDELGFCHYTTVTYTECVNELVGLWKERIPENFISFDNNNYIENVTDEEHLTFLSRQLQTGVLNFEVNLADHCNLNCQCCNHFSPISNEEYLDLEQYESDIKQIKRITNGRIGTMMLLGGEPLLHQEINEAILITRKYIEEAEISIVTNGLLLPDMDESFWKICKENKVGLLVTKYPVNFNYEKCEEIAKFHGVLLTYTLDSQECKTTYKLPISEEAIFNQYQSYSKCFHANKCVVLKKGRLYTCPIAAYIDKMNKRFGTSLPELESNSIDIYTVDNMLQLEKYLKKPIPMCKHCDISGYIYNIPWKTSTKSIEEWQ